jgi:hypothetical protein
MVVCVNEFTEKYSIDYKQAFNYLSKYKVVNFLIENYEVEHTLSIDNAIDDLEILPLLLPTHLSLRWVKDSGLRVILIFAGSQKIPRSF